MKIFFLTHAKELLRRTNTGRLASTLLGDDIEVVVWERTNPNKKLLERIEKGKVALVYPHETNEALSETSAYEAYIIIDSTWQEAQKIYNKSPYLHTLPCIKIETNAKSVYTLRRNQKEYGLCTAEIVVEVFKNNSMMSQARQLEEMLHDFISKRKCRH